MGDNRAPADEVHPRSGDIEGGAPVVRPRLVPRAAWAAGDPRPADPGHPAVVIGPADLDDPRVASLLEEHLAEMEPSAPPADRHALDLEAFRSPGVRLWVARVPRSAWAVDGSLVGSVALKDLGDGHVELKTMRVSPAGRGMGLGRRLLEHALAEAHAAGATRVSLETGTAAQFRPALALYRSAGFVECPPFGAYRATEHNTYLTRTL
ncbi:MAG: GNAT family N-acetyltransferase [Dermatophilaceae bacterium]